MDTSLFEKYSDAILTAGNEVLDPRLLMAHDNRISIYYAPFDAVNKDARLVLVGITPGKTQMRNAIVEARRHLTTGSASPMAALTAAKAIGGFSGPMRANLVALLDRIGVAAALDLSSSAELFGAARPLLQTTSVLPFPVFVDGEDYRGTPDPVSHPLLRSQIETHFRPLVESLPTAAFVPLGPVPTKVLSWMVGQGALTAERVLEGLPHPSLQNAERINYFLGRKGREQLSAKTNAQRLDSARRNLEDRVRLVLA